MSSLMQGKLQPLGQPNAPNAQSASTDHEAQAVSPQQAGLFARQDLYCYALLLVTVCVVFGKTIFGGQPVSHFNLIAEWDSLFAAMRRGLALHVDPSAVLMYVPTYTYIAQQLHAGHLPLWNCLSAFGSPVVGDIQSTLFSPFRLAYNIAPCLRVYNLQIVLNVLLAAWGSYTLARACRLGRIAALFAALSYSLCPYFLWYAELWGIGYALNPALTWLFLRAARAQTFRSAGIAGAGAGVMILSAHPEHSFFFITAATLVFALECVPAFRAPDKRDGSGRSTDTVAGDAPRVVGGGSDSALLYTIRQFMLVAVSALSALCVSAPVFFPFVEFLKNSDCYKYAVTEASIMPWQSLAYNLFAPGFGSASQFVGGFTVALILFGLLGNWKRARLPLIMWLVGLFVCAELWPLGELAKHPPFVYLQTTYATPIFLLFSCLLSAIGLEALAGRVSSKEATWRTTMVTVVVLIGCACLPLALRHGNLQAGDFDMTLPHMAFDMRSCVLNIALAAASALLLLVARGQMKWQSLLTCALAALSLGTLLSLDKKALPVDKPFVLPVVPAMQQLAVSGERIVALGTHLCKPDANLLFGVDDVRSINPMFPKRYISFIQACGVDSAEFSPVFSEKLLPALDLASVKYVLGQTPPLVPPEGSTSVSLSVPVTSDVSVSEAAVWQNAGMHAAFADVSFVVSEKAVQQLEAVAVLSDGNSVVWYSDAVPFSAMQAPDGHTSAVGTGAGTRRHTFSIPLPLNDIPTTYTLGARIYDQKQGAFLQQSAVQLAAIGPVQPAGQTAQASDRRFALWRDFGGYLRVYENKRALPRAYIVPSVVVARTEQEALKHVRDMDFDPRAAVVVEPEGDAPASLLQSSALDASQGRELRLQQSDRTLANSPSSDGSFMSLAVDRQDPNCVSTHYKRDAAGYLVLTDSFYPGWRAYVDGKQVRVMHANYMFRAIAVPPGEHKIEFRYEPVSFSIGLVLSSLFWLAVAAGFIGRRKEFQCKPLSTSSST